MKIVSDDPSMASMAPPPYSFGAHYRTLLLITSFPELREAGRKRAVSSA
jgi:hypothetical protein